MDAHVPPYKPGATADFETQNSASQGVLELDPQMIRSCLNRKPFLIGHRLASHAAFSLQRLVELSRKLPPNDVEYYDGNMTVDLDPKTYRKTNLSIPETIRRIEECGSWMVLKWVERDPEYKALLDACLDEVRVFSESVAPSMRQREAFIFISSPNTVTPYHMDLEYNFLLQIRGTKMFYVFDRACASEEDREQKFSGGHRNLQFKEEYQKTAYAFDLKPGLGVHVPVAAPHWIKNGNAVSVSFSITFRAPESDRESFIYRVNAHMRKFGINPTPVHQSPVIDAIKFNSLQTIRPFKVLIGKFRPKQEKPR